MKGAYMSYFLITSSEGEVSLERLTANELRDRLIDGECPSRERIPDLDTNARIYDLGGVCEGWILIKGDYVKLKKQTMTVETMVPVIE